jgi:deazaflavin-dependent oxidoreductase (nitroreductase family)
VIRADHRHRYRVTDSGIRFLSRLHRAVYTATAGRVGKRLVRNDMLLLTTTGRRTARPHTVPLLYLRDGDRYVVVASFGGRPYHPAWYLNLRAEASVVVKIGSRRFPGIASTATPDERSAWWPRIVRAYRGYAEYARRTDRTIPVVFIDAGED